ncbi:SAM-dependent methyltransferase [Streptomyces noursei]|uniref:SAM-dependent methyltransferase n=1 Tax=Streptomyces noursei TaxID=1971 RepID=UPI001678E486|nr:SAM-dependent methyltransferase [Streptomyces noursei]MCZ1020619.1 SAM-dependent methyltransferase [Streptomyces noursei]GGX37598.1 putative S-adenosyl-L-methionine-dependent methyltransferase [Streptomyces noursei]
MPEFEQWDIVTGVGLTALGVAAGRALETGRADRLVSDPYADAFLAAADAPVPVPRRRADAARLSAVARGMWTSMADYLGVRSRFFDRFLMTAAAGGITQVVVPAAGLDVRAFRLEWPPGVELFEIDQARVLEFKDGVLDRLGARPRCGRRVVPVDLRDDWPAALRDAGFDPGRATAWLAEGLLPFLPAAAERLFFDRIGRLSAPGSRLAAEHLAPSVRPLVEDPAFRAATRALGVDLADLWHFDGKADPGGALTADGWAVRSVPAHQVAAAYRRELHGVMGRTVEHSRFLTAER